MSNYIVASIGSSGSRLLVQMIEAASGLKHCNDDTEKWRGMILHTHKPFDANDQRLKPHNWRAVFIWSHIGDAINGFYEKRISQEVGLRLMNVEENARQNFLEREDRDPIGAWVELIEGDKLNWRKNLLAWAGAPNTYSINYEIFCLAPHGVCSMLSKFLDLEIPAPTIKLRTSNWLRLPDRIQAAIQSEYGDLLEIGNKIQLARKLCEVVDIWAN